MAYEFTILGADNVTTTSCKIPEYGYDVEIHLPIHVAEKHPFGYSMFDAGTAYDYRILSINSILFDVPNHESLVGYFNDATFGRGENVTFQLGATPTGFFPFGADLGDKGNFVCRVLDFQESGVLYSPYKYVNSQWRFVLVSAPAYTLPTEIDQGDLVIDEVSGLMPMQKDVDLEIHRAIRTDLTRDGSPYSVDGVANLKPPYARGGEVAFHRDITLDLILNKSKAAALLYTIVNSIRTDARTFQTSNYNKAIYGALDINPDFYLDALFLGSERTENEIIYRIAHETHDRFTMQIKVFAQGTD
jgi:hypothetical protein